MFVLDCLLLDILSGVKFSCIFRNVCIFVLFAVVRIFVDFVNLRFWLLYFYSFHVPAFKRFTVAPESSRKSISKIGFCFVKADSKLVHWYIGSIHVGLDSIVIIELQVSSRAL